MQLNKTKYMINSVQNWTGNKRKLSMPVACFIRLDKTAAPKMLCPQPKRKIESVALYFWTPETHILIWFLGLRRTSYRRTLNDHKIFCSSVRRLIFESGFATDKRYVFINLFAWAIEPSWLAGCPAWGDICMYIFVNVFELYAYLIRLRLLGGFPNAHFQVLGAGQRITFR